MPTCFFQSKSRLTDCYRESILKSGVQFINGIIVLLSASVKNTVNISLALHLRGDMIDIADTLQGGFVVTDNRCHAIKRIFIKALFPIGILCEGKQTLVTYGSDCDLFGLVLQHIRKIRKSFKVGADGVPIHTLKILFESRVLSRLVPLVRLVTLGNRFIAQEDTAARSFIFDILGKIGLNTAFRGVDFKSCENCKGFYVLVVMQLVLARCIFIVGENTAIEGGITDLTDARGKGIPYGDKSGIPIIRIRDQWLCCRYFQKRQLGTATNDALVDKRIGNGFDHITVKVRTAKPFGNERTSRDYITVGLLVNKLKLQNKTKIKTLSGSVPDCWIYVQEREVRLGRLQLYNNWSPYMVKDPENTMWMGLEYFCNEGDELWSMGDEEFIRFAIDELASIDVIDKSDVLDATRIKVKKAYPAYFDTYNEFSVVREYLDSIENLWCVGRNGQHRYNNMDHSMLTAVEAVRAIAKGSTDKSAVWGVNTEKEYHETDKEPKAEESK